ncbi:MAG: hypothetical protein HYS21_11645 [Deltaproteobacteria bacterium]|nr:hypothetical protein [Deltaproteobacteria bacterium]
MKVVKNRIILRLLLFILILVFAVNKGYTEELQALESKHVKIKAEQEILVTRDIGGGMPFSQTFSLYGWCGNTSFLIHGTETGIELMDFNGNKTTVTSKGTDYPKGCTPDGKWVIYEDRNSAREYRDRFGRLPENIVDDGPGWYGLVMDLYRYEITTGRRQKFAVVRDDSTALVSPDGLKVFLGNRHDSAIEMPEPKWETVWLTNDWTYFDTFWLPDSSGIVTSVWGDGASLGVEFFGQNAWAKEFTLEQINPGEKYIISLEAVGSKGRLYFVMGDEYLIKDRKGWHKYHFAGCEIKNKRLTCEAIGEFDAQNHYTSASNLLANGDFVFKEDGDNCIRLLKPEHADGGCIADTRFKNEIYEDIYLIGTSPDGKWMAFRRGKLPPSDKRFYAYQYDLFVKELSDD